MPEQTTQDRPDDVRRYGITAVSIRGFKSHAFENRIDVRHLTILAGANSSGKSSIVQPLLLMKQTLEASYDPGPLLLNGPNVRCTSVDQILSSTHPDRNHRGFSVGIEMHGASNLQIEYAYSSNQELEIPSMSIALSGRAGESLLRLTPGDDSTLLKERISAFPSAMNLAPDRVLEGLWWAAVRDRCFLSIVARVADADASGVPHFHLPHLLPWVPDFELIRMIHVSGSRGNPERVYSRATLTTIPVEGTHGPRHYQLFPGTFEKYVATVIAGWQSSGDARLKRLETMLRDLGLGQELAATRINDTQIELRVGTLFDTPSSDRRLVSIADVGFGVSQVLPVLVALLVADAGQLVYVEQPELHLHPRAQCAVASIMADAARRGVRLIVETHSALLLLRVRTLVANAELDPKLVKLHWFSLREDGNTAVKSANLDEDGAYGDWPEDFGDVELAAEGMYLDAVEQRNGT